MSTTEARRLGLAALATIAGLGGCTASAEDVRPPQDQLAFPTGMALSPDERALFVVNANSELRFDSGSIGVIDVDKVEAVIKDWEAPSKTIPSGCSRDPDHIETLVCDEAQFFKKDAGVRVGNFATDLTVQDFGNGRVRVFAPTRGDPSIAWADYDGNELHCNDNSDSYPLCDDAHRLTSLDNNPDLAPLPIEPFSVFATAVPAFDGAGNRVASTKGFALVTHIATGAVTLIDAPADSSQVQIVDMISNVFAPDLVQGTGLRGASSITGRQLPAAPGTPPGELIYTASSTEDRVQLFTVAERDDAAAYLLPGNFFFLTAVGNGAGNSSDTRSLRFSSNSERLYLVNRMPPSLQVWDTSIGPTGVPNNTPLGSSDVCRQASTLAVANFAPEGQEVVDRVYVTCFQDGEVYVVDPTGQSHVEDIISVGRGPYAVAVLTGINLNDTNAAKPQLFVSNFLEDTIAVIDLSLTSANRNRVVLRIGTPRVP